MSLIRTLFWVLLFVFFVFCFIVLFEYGPHEFVFGFKKESEHVEKMVREYFKPTTDKEKKK